jgi:hypothetical protein
VFGSRRTVVAILFALMIAGLACGPEARAPATFPVRPAEELLMRRVQAAFDGGRRSARFWPGFEKTRVTAMLIYDERGEWFFGDSRDLRGFYPTGQQFNDLPVNYAEPSLFLSGEVKPYARIRRIDGWLGRIGWRDFDADTRHSRSEPMMIMQELSVALTNEHGLASTEDWIGVYVHETFHVFQHDFSAVRRASTIGAEELGDRDVLEQLARGGDYRAAVASEFVILNGAVNEATTKESAKGTLRRWLTARDERIRRYEKAFGRAGAKGDLDRIDVSLMSREGTARYVEQRYLTTPEALEDPALATDPQSLQFETGKAKVSRRVSYTGVGNYLYTLGDLVCRLLDVADESWKSKVFDRRRLLIGAVEAAIE